MTERRMGRSAMGLAVAALASVAGAIGNAKAQAVELVKSATAYSGGTGSVVASSSWNGGRRRTNKQNVRAAIKKRNQRKNKLAHRGRAR